MKRAGLSPAPVANLVAFTWTPGPKQSPAKHNKTEQTLLQLPFTRYFTYFNWSELQGEGQRTYVYSLYRSTFNKVEAREFSLSLPEENLNFKTNTHTTTIQDFKRMSISHASRSLGFSG